MTTRLSSILGLACLVVVSVFLLAIRISPTAENELVNLTTADEKLLIFTQVQDQHFLENSLPQIKEWAEQENIELLEMDIQQGVPATITATPAVVFVNQSGNAIYASRYAELGTIKNFVRTSRVRPQNQIPLCDEDVLSWEQGRGRIHAKIKQTVLSGTKSTHWEDDAWQAKINTALQQGMNNFAMTDGSCLARTDRAFYCDIHPYLAEDGQLYLSLELFSMFNCIRSVYQTGDTPLVGKMEECEALFVQAGQVFQAQIIQVIQQSEIGDAWTPLPEDTPVKSWEALGFSVTALDEAVTIFPDDFQLSTQWESPQAAIPGVPSLFFRFMEPLDRYAGEVPNFEGELSLHPNGSLRSGNFTAKLKSLTMGMAELDDKVKRKYIYTKRFPEASFEFNLPVGTSLEAGQVNRIPVEGTFRFMKQEQEMRLQAELTPQLDDNGQQELYVHAQFDLNITDDYGIKGPDGPEKASKTMVFDLNFFLVTVKK
ncbi:MAG: YceI family protein [Bacteroidota bacterium]